jgi:protein SCO1
MIFITTILSRVAAVKAHILCAITIGVVGVYATNAYAHEGHDHEPKKGEPAYTTRIQRDIAPPDIALLTQGKQATRMAQELQAAQPQVLNFVFTTCSTICSTQTATLASFQKKLNTAKLNAKFMSFTIDPDNDTPEQLAKFAQQFGIGDSPQWRFFTGRFDDMVKPQQAFNVYRGSKASHPPVVLLRKGAASPWVRVEGFPSADDLLRVYRSLPQT